MAASNGALTPRRVDRSADQLFLFCFLSYTCSYIGRKNLSACLPGMIASGLLDKSEAGYITTAYMAVYGLGQLLWGVVATKVKPQYLIGTGLLGAALCNLGMGLCRAAWLMPFIWAANGLFHAMLWAPIIRIFTERLPAGKRARAGVNISASCSVGAILAFLLPAGLLRVADWRVVFFAAGGILLTAFLVWVLGHVGLRRYIRFMDAETERSRAAAVPTEAATVKAATKKPSLPGVILGSGVWLLLFSLFCNGALRDAVETWAPTYLAEQFSLNGSLAALTAVIIPIVSVTGSYIAEGLHRRWIRNEATVCVLMFGVSVLCMAGVCLFGRVSPVLTAALLAVCISAMFGANHMYLTVIPYHFAPLGLSAGVSGFLNCAVYFATALCSSLYGLLAERFGWSVLTLVWLGIGLLGAVLALVGGRVWAKGRAALDEGRIWMDSYRR